jgi:excinuclease ABC subunit C
MKESLLDDCPGMTAARKALLMKHFGSVAEMRRSSAEQIGQVRGIPKGFAESMHKWLHRAE